MSLNTSQLCAFSKIVAQVQSNTEQRACQRRLVAARLWTDECLKSELQTFLNARTASALIQQVPNLQPLDSQAPSVQPLDSQTIKLQDLNTLDTNQLAQALRCLRRSVVAALAELDLTHHAALEQITACITDFAAFALRIALSKVGQTLADQYGVPTDPLGIPLDIHVAAMGKLGGGELNISSDIDLVFMSRDADGDTAGVAVHGLKRCISNREFLTSWARQTILLLNTEAADGFVFRVDMRLRPHGNDGPLVTELSMLEDYLVSQGRMWERLAWLKASAIYTPVFQSAAQHASDHAAWLAVITPFVYRRYLDYTVIDSLRHLHGLIRKERHAFEFKRHEGVHVKLARGGIRELEFWVQGQQLIHAGRNVQLRAKASLDALEALASAGKISSNDAKQSSKDYRFLRRVEHVLQYREDAQTHTVPSDDTQRQQIALALGFLTVAAFDAELTRTMNTIATQFDRLFAADQQTKQHEKNDRINSLPTGLQTDDDANNVAAAMPPSQPSQTLLSAWLEQVERTANTDATRLLLGDLLHHVMQLCDSDTTFERVATFVLMIAKRRSYIDILMQYPPVLGRIVALMKASHFAANYLSAHPSLIDELIDADSLYAPVDWSLERRRLLDKLNGLDEETQLHVLCEAHHAWVLRVLAQDLDGKLDLLQVSDALSAAADTVLDAALCCVNAKFTGEFSVPAGLAIIAYGKLGGKELGYGSDLDIVFLVDDALAGAIAEQYPRWVQRLISILTVNTAAGRLFEIDTALRPNGSAGLLLTHASAFRHYQLGESAGTKAWVWEHQAISRARWCAGDQRIEPQFDMIRLEVLSLSRDEQSLKNEIIDMRLRMSAEMPVAANLFDVKLSPCGMIDIEFAVQYVVLRYAAAHTRLQLNLGNVALLEIAASAGLIESKLASSVGILFQKLRQTQHACKLAGQPTVAIQLNSSQYLVLQPHLSAVQQLLAALGLTYSR